jgi:hypothetical protein
LKTTFWICSGVLWTCVMKSAVVSFFALFDRGMSVWLAR